MPHIGLISLISQCEKVETIYVLNEMGPTRITPITPDSGVIVPLRHTNTLAFSTSLFLSQVSLLCLHIHIYTYIHGNVLSGYLFVGFTKQRKIPQIYYAICRCHFIESNSNRDRSATACVSPPDPTCSHLLCTVLYINEIVILIQI